MKKSIFGAFALLFFVTLANIASAQCPYQADVFSSGASITVIGSGSDSFQTGQATLTTCPPGAKCTTQRSVTLKIERTAGGSNPTWIKFDGTTLSFSGTTAYYTFTQNIERRDHPSPGCQNVYGDDITVTSSMGEWYWGQFSVTVYSVSAGQAISTPATVITIAGDSV